MANNTPFRKVTPTRSADKYLKELEELMRLNRGGGMLVGYDTDTNRPIYMPGKVANPTGLEGYASKSLLNLPELPQSVPELVPNFGDMNVDQLLDYGSTADISKLTPDQLMDLFDAIDFQNNNIQQNLNAPIDNPNYSAPTNDANPIPSQTSVNPLTKTNKSNFSQPYQDALLSQTPKLPPQGSGTGNADTMWNTGWNIGFNHPDTPYAGNDINERSGYERGQQEYLNRKPTLDFNQYMQVNENNLKNADQILNTPERDFTKNPATQEEINASGARGLARTHARNLGITEEQLNANNNIDLPTWTPEKPNPIKSARMALGNFVEGVGDAIPGLGEHNISEWIAGGPTKHSRVMAADNIKISEPGDLNYQAGSGIESLQKGLQPGAVQQSTRPPISSVNPATPMIGNFAGIPASAVQSATKGMSQNTPAQMTPINPATPAVQQNTRQTQKQTYNQPSNQPSNQSSGSSYSPPKAVATSNYKPPVATPTKYIPPKQPAKIPLSTYGVGSVSPPPAQKPAAKSNNIFSSVMNAINNLFRRRQR